MIFYKYMRHHLTDKTECDSVREAFDFAVNDFEFGEAWPAAILDDEKILWQEEGPLRTRDGLARFAEANGFPLPEDF